MIGEAKECGFADLVTIPVNIPDFTQFGGMALLKAVCDLKARIIACDGLLLATPEYNNGIPGVFKNAIDWLSRPSADHPKVFPNCPVAVIGASPGGFGTVLAQAHWLPVLRALGTHTWFGERLMVSAAHKVFNENGEIADEVVRNQLRDFLHGFGQFVQASAAPRG